MKKLLIALILLMAAPVWAGPMIEYVTPAASETVAGTTERCTDAEMVAGTSTACAGTPANLTAKLSAAGVALASSGTITAAMMKGQVYTNYGQTNDATQTLEAAFDGANFCIFLSTTVAKYYWIDPASGDSIYKDAATAGDGKYVGFASAAAGDAVCFQAVRTDASAYDWIVSYIGPLISE
jgi:hypothetical protein